LPLSQVTVVLDRGPFDVATDQVLMQDHRITHVVAKNSGGAGAVAKMTAARGLSLPVLMVDRPVLPGGPAAPDAEAVMRWLDHSADRGV
jgi:precorrin-6A/cobalt-precorrin-6A reductase